MTWSVQPASMAASWIVFKSGTMAMSSCLSRSRYQVGGGVAAVKFLASESIEPEEPEFD